MELILTYIALGLSVTVLILAAALAFIIIKVKAKSAEREAVHSKTVSAIYDAIKALEDSPPMRAELTELKTEIERANAICEKVDRLSVPEDDAECKRLTEELERLQGFYDKLKKKEMALRGAIKEANRELSLACGTDSLEYLIEAVNKTVDALTEALEN